MSIINFQYAGPLQLDDQLGKYTYPTTPAWDKGTPTYSDGSYAENFYYSPYKDNQKSINTQGDYPVIDLLPESFDELWFRLFYKMNTVSIAGAIEPLKLYNSADVKVASLYFSGTTVLWKTFNNTGTETSSTTIGVLSSSNWDNTNKNFVLDFRIKLNPVAGFVQMYDYTTTVKGEILGKTIESSAVLSYYKISINRITNDGSYDRALPLFCILADEPTFSMYVIPLLAKAEGSLQGQDIGSSYANLLSRKRNPTDNGFVNMTLASGQSKKYSLKLQNLTDRSIGANYILKSLKFGAIFETEQTSPTPLNVSLLMRGGDGSEHSYVVPPILPNTNASYDSVWQNRSKLLHNNPITNTAWGLTDLDALEFGFTATGV